MWANFISRLALFVSVLFTLAVAGSGTLALIGDFNMLYSNPLKFWGCVVGYIVAWFIGVSLVYSIAWVLCGKNVLPLRNQA